MGSVVAGLAGLTLAAEAKRKDSDRLSPVPKPSAAQVGAEADGGRRLAGYLAYRTWECITPQRMTMERGASTGCTFGGLTLGVESKDLVVSESGVLNLLSLKPPAPEETAAKAHPESTSPAPAPSVSAATVRVSPHTKSVVLVYANAPALARAATIEDGGHLPVGSILVKEKYETRGAAQPQLITVMEKTGDTGTVDDWLFTMVKLPEGQIVREHTNVECALCHSEYDRTDFVSVRSFNLLQQFAKEHATARK